jgi:hypothetical protein
MNIILLALSLNLYNKFYHYLIIIVTINLSGLNAVPPSVLREHRANSDDDNKSEIFQFLLLMCSPGCLDGPNPFRAIVFSVMHFLMHRG